jgi:hypothetical protein
VRGGLQHAIREPAAGSPAFTIAGGKIVEIDILADRLPLSWVIVPPWT